MATEQKILDLSYVADEDLSNDQYRFVVQTSTGVRRPNAETDVSLGILQNAPAAGEAAVVRVIGISKCQMNNAAGVGTFVLGEYVSATDAGKGKTSAGAPSYTRGVVVEASAAEDDLASVMLIGQFPGITDAVSHTTVVTTEVTAGAHTYTIDELLGGMILRDCAGGSRSDVSPTATLIVAGVAGAITGSSFEFTIKNTSDAAETITLTAGTDVTLSGTMTIAQNNSKRFLAVITNAATPAVTIYSLGTVVH